MKKNDDNHFKTHSIPLKWVNGREILKNKLINEITLIILNSRKQQKYTDLSSEFVIRHCNIDKVLNYRNTRRQNKRDKGMLKEGYQQLPLHLSATQSQPGRGGDLKVKRCSMEKYGSLQLISSWK